MSLFPRKKNQFSTPQNPEKTCAGVRPVYWKRRCRTRLPQGPASPAPAEHDTLAPSARAVRDRPERDARAGEAGSRRERHTSARASGAAVALTHRRDHPSRRQKGSHVNGPARESAVPWLPWPRGAGCSQLRKGPEGSAGPWTQGRLPPGTQGHVFAGRAPCSVRAPSPHARRPRELDEGPTGSTWGPGGRTPPPLQAAASPRVSQERRQPAPFPSAQPCRAWP